MTRREAINWVREIPTLWKAGATIAVASSVGWAAHGKLNAQASLVPRVSAVEARLDTAEMRIGVLRASIDSTNGKLDRIECLVLVVLGEGSQARCIVQ